MPGMLYANPGPSFVGHTSIFQFSNSDGADPDTACGQAAIATVLANRGKIPKSIVGLQQIEKAYPGDFLSGAWGTSVGRVESAMAEYNLGHHHVARRKGLEEALRLKHAAIVLIQNSPGLGALFREGAHWFVVFGGDTNGVHVTNYPKIFLSWSEFEVKWSGIAPTSQGMGMRAISC
jgi:hypothetical protein